LTKGFSVAECAAIRRLSPVTILEQACQAARAAHEVPLEPFREFPFEDCHLELLDELKRRVLWDGNPTEEQQVF
jgi:hypothetical protein